MNTEHRGTGIFALAAVAMFAVLAARLWQLQILEGKEFSRHSSENRLRIEKIPSPRGIIHDRNGKPLVKNLPYFHAALLPEMIEKADLKGIAAFLSMDIGKLNDIISRQKDPFMPIKLKGGLSFREVAFMESRLSDYPGLTIHVEHTRHYQYGSVGAHIVGYLGKLNPYQIKKSAFRNIPRQASIGQVGVERMFDGFLRGVPGKRVIEVDALGRRLRLLKEEFPDKGSDLYLSIDIDLQMEAERAFGNWSGALVAVKPSTGEVLALVSKPTFNPNLFLRGINYDDWLKLAEDKRFPLLNRALQSHFPPGSVFKIITAIAALEEGAITPYTKTTCTGRLKKGKWVFRCWNRGGHGALSLYSAIVESCDVYFYAAGERVGIDNIAKYARLFGLGAETGLGLVTEKTGLIPDIAWKRRVKNKPWFVGETYNAAIGQGYVLTTPAQVARMTAAVANGGRLYDLMLNRADSQPEPASEIKLGSNTLRRIKAAMRGVVSGRRGTGAAAISNIVDIAGKTGTAQVISSRGKYIRQRDLPHRFRDHAWFTAFAPVKDPAIAVTVFVEHGGSGGETAAPIAKQVIETYIKKLNTQTRTRKAAPTTPTVRPVAPSPSEITPTTPTVRPVAPSPAEITTTAPPVRPTAPSPAEITPTAPPVRPTTPSPAEITPTAPPVRPTTPSPAEITPTAPPVRPTAPSPAEITMPPAVEETPTAPEDENED